MGSEYSLISIHPLILTTVATGKAPSLYHFPYLEGEESGKGHCSTSLLHTRVNYEPPLSCLLLFCALVPAGCRHLHCSWRFCRKVIALRTLVCIQVLTSAQMCIHSWMHQK